ncbi:MAG: hypothetical protein KatS3mg084_0281 [Candidatus Dojkabacteria bacterium]|nr:MAG: hypothetical protein KatS3mg084_0281 [Candidatus Dojkabacteria bacterium]
MNTQVNPQNVVSVNHNLPQYSPTNPPAMRVNAPPAVGSVSGSAPQAVYGVPQSKSGSKMKSFVLISCIVLVIVCCVCTVCSFLLVANELAFADEQKKFLYRSWIRQSAKNLILNYRILIELGLLKSLGRILQKQSL